MYAPEDLMPHATEIVLESGAIIYDALFLALAKDSGTVMVTRDTELLDVPESIPYACLAHPLADVGRLILSIG